jgi:hypothetical protein
MPDITLNFQNPLNVSIQADSTAGDRADIVYFKSGSNIYRIGPCKSITDNSLVCETTSSSTRPTAGDFIFFAKSARANTSGIIGYHAVVDMEITSADKKELYAVGSEVVLSS